MSWLSLCLDSADRQISGEMRVMAFVWVQPLHQSVNHAGWEQAAQPSSKYCLSLSPRLFSFSSKSHPPVPHNEQLYVQKQKNGTYPTFPPTMMLHFLLGEKCPLWTFERVDSWIALCFLYGGRLKVFWCSWHLHSTHCHHNESIIICTIF